jgi:hypothetical protein
MKRMHNLHFGSKLGVKNNKATDLLARLRRERKMG